MVAKKIQPMEIIVAYGGWIFNLIPEIRKRIPGIFLGEVLEEVPAKVPQLLNLPVPEYQVEDLSETYKETLQSFQSHLANIESTVLTKMRGEDLPHTHLTIANTNMSQNIIAALILGEITVLGYDIQWIKDLLRNHGIPEENLNPYISAYAEAVSKDLDHDGELISEYLFSLIQNQNNTSQNA